jgi:polyphosphate kinase
MANKNRIINRELSWLAFNERVLQEAMDPNVPLIERFRFLGIYSNNQDEFFKVRVATIKRMIDVAESISGKSSKKPRKILNEIQKKVIQLRDKFEQTYTALLKDLAQHNIHIINEKQLNQEQADYVRMFFQEEVLSVITPVMLHNVKKFPQLRDKSIYLAIKMTSSDTSIEPEYALIEIPGEEIGRFVVLPPDGKQRFIILLDDVIRFCLDDIFDIFHYDQFEGFTIKLTRDAELDIDNDLSKSFLEKIDSSVTDRKKGQPVRFVYDSSMPDDFLNYFITTLKLDDEDNLIPGGRYHNFKDYMKFPNMGLKSLEYRPTPAISHPDIKPHKSIMQVLQKKDILLHVPFQKFDHYINLLREAAIDPNVISISISLYRVANNSRVINALISAAMNGKKVTVIIELQARFDEKSNIFWARSLEEAGARVLFGLPGLKVHAKLSLITRRENRKMVRYASVGTGNFHEGTAQVYGDLSLLTSDPRITSEVNKIFNFFDTTYKTFKYKHLLVSPLYMRNRLTSMVEKEIRNAREGKDAYILLKINSMVDEDMIKKLYQANAAGVKIKAIIRGMCSLIPGVPGQSENIEVISIVDKFLEHARIFVFCNNNDEKYYISSADWMPRNLDHRVEVACPIYDPEIQMEIRDILEIQMKDNVKARIIEETQANNYRQSEGSRPVQSQMELYKYYQQKS